ncbi:MAG: TonB-dependent receptor domain-containing protein [Gemmatimonadaceae bacterium]
MKNRSVAATALLLGVTAVLFTFLFLFLPNHSAAQVATGRVTGRIIDRQTGLGIPDVGVQVVGTTAGVMSGVDGRYNISAIPAGTVSLHVRRIGYQPKTVTALMLPANGSVEQDITLDVASVQLQTLVVTAAAERGTVNEALDQQRRATGIVNAITAEQIAKSPDSDAAAAIQRVSGVTVQDGRYVFVRGLGERYTTTTLNGARVPSPEPERKVVPLDLFPSALLQSVTTSKTFTPDQSGDFAGAQVNIKTREFPAQRQVQYSLSLGYNDRATGKSVLRAPRTGLEWLGFGGGERSLPAIVASAGNFSNSPTQQQYNQMVSSFRNAWSVEKASGAPNTSAGISIGGNDSFLGRRIGYIGSLAYSHNQEVRSDEVRAFAIPVSNGGGSVGTEEVDRYEGNTGRSTVLWGGLFNLSTLVNTHSRLSLDNTYTRSADNEARYEEGFDENTGLPFQIQRLRYVERSVRSTQLAGEHDIGGRHKIDWALTASGVTRIEPDRSEVAYAIDEQQASAPFLFGSNESAVRTFGDLTETSYNASSDYTLRFGEPGRGHLLKIGGVARSTSRDAQNSAFSVLANLPISELVRPPEEIFDDRFTQSGSSVFRVVPLSQSGSYKASDLLGAGYGMVEYQFMERLRFIGGVRVEYSALEVTSFPAFGSALTVKPTYTDVLPSAALNVQLTEQQNLRLSASQTLARPEYRELVGINQRDVLGGEQFRGNPALKRTLIQNADARWEWYPNPGEVLSLGIFAKRFQDPIERVYRGTSGTRVTTFENANSADNYGVEVEVRKSLAFASQALSNLTVFSNVTVMRSEIDVANVGAGSVEANRAMVGQAPYVLNGGLTYATDGGRASATVLYNVVGRRVFAASLLPLPSVYEQERHVLDLSFRFPIWQGLSGKLDGKNLLDSPYEVTQGSVTREYYRAGRAIAGGLTWRP